MRIEWTPTAEKTFYKNLQYLFENWTNAVSDEFQKEVFLVLDLLLKNPFLGKKNNDFNAYSILITKQISLIYEVQNNSILLLTFWDNRQKPIKI